MQLFIKNSQVSMVECMQKYMKDFETFSLKFITESFVF